VTGHARGNLAVKLLIKPAAPGRAGVEDSERTSPTERHQGQSVFESRPLSPRQPITAAVDRRRQSHSQFCRAVDRDVTAERLAVAIRGVRFPAKLSDLLPWAAYNDADRQTQRELGTLPWRDYDSISDVAGQMHLNRTNLKSTRTPVTASTRQNTLVFPPPRTRS
jgi:hypothetical protein